MTLWMCPDLWITLDASVMCEPVIWAQPLSVIHRVKSSYYSSIVYLEKERERASELLMDQAHMLHVSKIFNDGIQSDLNTNP